MLALFSDLLFQALERGFVEKWETCILPKTQHYKNIFETELAKFSELDSGIMNTTWTLSFPLLTHGRIFRTADGGVNICVGVADDELGVSVTHPLFQGFHEYTLSKLHHSTYSPDRIATVPSREGYKEFASFEEEGLIQGAALLGSSNMREEYHDWLSAISL